jgi:hypothetical protein
VEVVTDSSVKLELQRPKDKTLTFAVHGGPMKPLKNEAIIGGELQHRFLFLSLYYNQIPLQSL